MRVFVLRSVSKSDQCVAWTLSLLVQGTVFEEWHIPKVSLHSTPQSLCLQACVSIRNAGFCAGSNKSHLDRLHALLVSAQTCWFHALIAHDVCVGVQCCIIVLAYMPCFGWKQTMRMSAILADVVHTIMEQMFCFVVATFWLNSTFNSNSRL